LIVDNNIANILQEEAAESQVKISVESSLVSLLKITANKCDEIQIVGNLLLLKA